MKILNENENQQYKDYVLLMLGAPVINLEFTEQQLEMFVNLASEATFNAVNRLNVELIKMGTLAYAKYALGRIRGKFNKLPGPGCKDGITLDGPELIKEGLQDLKEWEKWLKLSSQVVRKFNL